MSGGNGKKNGNATSARTIEKPQDWDNVLSASYLRLLGATQEQAAKAVGCDRRTIQIWEASAFWPQATQEATTRWLDGLRGRAMDGLHASVKRDGRLALSVLERMMSELAPPKQQVHLEVDLNVKDLRERISDRLRRIAITN